MAAVVDKRRDSLSQVAYDQIKTMILQKDLTPGQFINEAQLQALLGLGRTPVREAVLALAQDKLVHIHPRKGIEISRPTLKDIHDIFEIRSLLEPLILHQCFHQVDLQWAVDMRTLLLQHQDDEAGNAGQTAAPLIELDNEFHLKLVDTLHNQYASQLMRSLTEYLNLPVAVRAHSALLSGGHQYHDSLFLLVCKNPRRRESAAGIFICSHIG